jgi:hypothetical protein
VRLVVGIVWIGRAVGLELLGEIDLAIFARESLAGAKNLGEATELQTAYWHKQLAALTAQAEEFRLLSTKVAADAVAPMKVHEGRV